jgi:signal transduction histidine kinase
MHALVRAARSKSPLFGITGSGMFAEFEDGNWRVRWHITGEKPLSDWWGFPPFETIWGTNESVMIEYSRADGTLLRQVDTPYKDWNANLYQDDAGRLFRLGDHGVDELMEDGWARRFAEPSNPNANSYAMLDDGKGGFYIGRFNGLEFWSAEEKVRAVFKMRSADLRSIARLEDGSLWCGTFGKGALRIYLDSGKMPIRIGRDFLSTHVSNIMQVEDGTIWFSSRQTGVTSFRDGHFVRYGFVNGLPNTGVKYMAEAPDGTLLASVDGGGVYRYSLDSWGPDTRIIAGPNEISSEGVGVFSFSGYDAWNDTEPRNLLYSWRVLDVAQDRELFPWSALSSVTTIALPRIEAGKYVFEVQSSDDRRNIDSTPAQVMFRVEAAFWQEPAFLVPLFLFSIVTALALLITYRMRNGRVASELERIESNQRLAALIMNVPGCVYKLTTSPCIQIVYLSPSIKELASYELGHFTPSGRVRWEDLVYGKDWKNVVEPCLMRLEAGQSFRLEYRIVDAHGDIHWVVDQGRMSDSQGEGSLWVDGILHDITDLKHLEGQLRQSQKMEAVGQLAGGIAHDFNNLLQIIQGYGDMALEQSEADGQMHEALKQVIMASDRAAALVRQLLAFSRKQVLKLEEMDLSVVSGELASMIQRVIGEHIAINTISEPGVKSIRADKGQIEQILMNLCVNARDAMADSGTLTIKTHDIELDTEFCGANIWAKPGRYVVLSVSDTGCGMDSDTQRRIFEPFFTTKELGKGTGLGLSTVFGIVHQHNGMVHVYSEPGVGTTFRIYFPMSGVAETAYKKNETAPTRGGSETILLADDDEGVRTVAEILLCGAGYTVLAAVDGEEAIRLFDEHADVIDLVLLDVVMPKLGGRAVFEHIQERRPQTRALFASGYSADGIHSNFVLDDGMQLIQKPYHGAALLRRVRDILDS